MSTENKKLSGFAIFALTFSSMMGSGVFDAPQNIASRAGIAAVVYHWIVIIVGILALSWSFVYITRLRPDIKSGVYGYAKIGFGQYVGFNIAWGYWLSALLGNVSYLIYLFAILGKFAAIFGQGASAGITLAAVITESMVIWLLFLLIMRGVQSSSAINSFITCLKLSMLAAVVILFCYGFHWSYFMNNLHVNPVHLGSMTEQIKSTMLVTVWDFIGIEAACLYAANAKSVQSIVRATMFAVIIVLVLDIMISCLPFGIMPTSTIQQLASPSTAGIIATIIGNIGGDFIGISVIICVAGALLAWQMLAVNILVLAAEGGSMPSVLAKISHNGVPINANLASCILVQIFILCAYFSHAIYITMIQVASCLILIPYVVSSMFALKLICTAQKINKLVLLGGCIAFIYTLLMIYAGGLEYLAISSSLYLLGTLVFMYQRKPIFVTNAERFICVGIAAITIVSIFWQFT